MKKQHHTTRGLQMNVLRSVAAVAVVASAIGLAGCGSSSSDLTPATTITTKSVGYVINTGGSAIKVPGFSIIDRSTNSVKKTIRITDGTPSVGHFANLTVDGSELWLCTNRADGSAGDVNILNTAIFDTYSTLNSSNKSSFIKKAFTGVGCGVQSTQTPDGKYLFTANGQGTKGINVFDVLNRTYLGNITNSNTAPHVGAVSPDGKTYYTTTAEKFHAVGYNISGLPAKVPTDADKVLDVDLGYGNLHALRIHPNGKYLFIGNNTWPVPTGATSTSGLNVIDVATKRIIKTVPGRPHNYTISLDAKYLSSTENPATNCDITPGDPGSLVQFIDISTLLTGTPDPAKIVSLYQFVTPGYGGSHAAWDATTGLYYYSVSDTAGQGWLYVLNTANLSAATPSVSVVVDKAKIGWAPHGFAFAGINGD